MGKVHKLINYPDGGGSASVRKGVGAMKEEHRYALIAVLGAFHAVSGGCLVISASSHPNLLTRVGTIMFCLGALPMVALRGEGKGRVYTRPHLVGRQRGRSLTLHGGCDCGISPHHRL